VCAACQSGRVPLAAALRRVPLWLLPRPRVQPRRAPARPAALRRWEAAARRGGRAPLKKAPRGAGGRGVVVHRRRRPSRRCLTWSRRRCRSPRRSLPRRPRGERSHPLLGSSPLTPRPRRQPARPWWPRPWRSPSETQAQSSAQNNAANAAQHTRALTDRRVARAVGRSKHVRACPGRTKKVLRGLVRCSTTSGDGSHSGREPRLSERATKG
jgi:hypothetical protein